jgi:hypothetical protein
MKKSMKHGLFIGIAVLLTAALALVSCSNAGGGGGDGGGEIGGGGDGGGGGDADTGNPPPSFNGIQVHNTSGGTINYVDYVTVSTYNMGYGGNRQENILSDDVVVFIDNGKLTLTLPDEIPSSKLFPGSMAMITTPGAKFAAIQLIRGIVTAMPLSPSPRFELRSNPTDGDTSLLIFYFDRAVNGSVLSASKGWHYFTSGSGGGTITEVTDISNYKWTEYTSNAGDY